MHPLPKPSANQVFSPARFGRLFRRHAAEHAVGYALGAALLGGGLLLLLSYASYLNGGALPPAIQMVLLTLTLLGAGSYFSSGMFSAYGQKLRGMTALTLPASHLEKFLVGWLWSLPLFLGAFLAVFYAADALVLHLAAQPGQTAQLLPPRELLDPEGGLGLLLLYAALNGVWLWGSLFFARRPFVRLGVVLVVALVLVITLNVQVVKALVAPAYEVMVAAPFGAVALRAAGQFYKLALPPAQEAWFGLLPLGLAGLLWVAAYYRLTEKQL